MHMNRQTETQTGGCYVYSAHFTPWLQFTLHFSALTLMASDVNKDWTCKDKDQAYKDQDKD